MSTVKHNFDGIARASATMVFTAMAASPMAFITRGVLGQVTFFFLKKVMNWSANQGLAILNLGVDSLRIAQEKRTFDRQISEALAKVQATKRRLTQEEKNEIDAPVIDAFRRFARFV